ncbi:unnamed protein product [Cylindrotheca closterium]|uniref:Ion transport domain-containing protein n=1 Tax=Cylindrotheca closterium TaxID=2856 RepID=A0AAD2FS72_9STRA|nr:unnamed protein product [Cylindrotheca closterium]
MIDPSSLPTTWEVDSADFDEDASVSSNSEIVVEIKKSPMSNRRKTRITFTTNEMKEGLRQSRAVIASFTEITKFEDSDEEMKKNWMQVFNDNIMQREEINKRQFSENVWRQLVLLQDVKGMLLLHHACRRKASPATIKWLKGDDNDTLTLSHASHDGSLPIHAACRAIAPFEVVKMVMKDSDKRSYLNFRDGAGHLPLDLIGKGEPTGEKKGHLGSSLRLDDNPIFDSFAEKMFEHLINDATSEEEEIFLAMDAMCNACPAKKFQTIVCSNLRSNTCIEWLTWAFCQPNVILYIMRDFYCQLAGIILIFYASHTYLQGHTVHYVVYALYGIALVFLVREIRQIRRYVKANIFTDYLKDPWNWLDCSTILLVTMSAVMLQISDPNNNPNDYFTRRLLMITGSCQVAHFVSFLRKVFLPFATFVGGLAKVFGTLVPFIVCTGLVLLAFAFMYYVQNFNNPEALGELPYNDLWTSFQSVLLMFLDAPESTETMVDALFGLITSIILLNVVIAIVSIAWGRSTEQEMTQQLFWEYRLAFVQDVTLTKNPGKKKKGKTSKATNIVSERFDKSRSIRQEQIADPFHTVRYKRVLLYTGYFFQYVVYFVLGLFTFGLCWPDKIKRDIFGIKFQEVKYLMKPEIYETRRVHTAVTTKMAELDSRIKEQADDNRQLMEQNKSLHEKIDRLESSMDKMSEILSQIDVALNLQSKSSRPMRMLPSGEVQVVSNGDAVEDEGNDDSSSKLSLEQDQVPRIA